MTIYIARLMLSGVHPLLEARLPAMDRSVVAAGVMSILA